MKKIFLSLLAVAALASCTKSEVILDHENEIGFAPSTKNITKAAMDAGALNTNEKLGIWAYWDEDGTPINTLNDYTAFNKEYLNDAEFIYKTVTTTERNSVSSWGGNGIAYPWPIGGSLVFAGYNKPTLAQSDNYSVSYSLSSDEIVFTNYKQSNQTAYSFDLCWFNRTSASYNNRLNGTAVQVTLSHALSWITILVKGEGLPATAGWKITNITLNNIAIEGTGTCTGIGQGKATWSSSTFATNVEIYKGGNNPASLTSKYQTLENVQKGTVIIPQVPTTLSVTYEYPVGDSSVPANWVSKTESVDLKISDTTADNKWLSGTHYTYSLIFKGNEILVAPSYGEWTNAADKTITVE